MKLYAILERTKYESKSQPQPHNTVHRTGCMQYQKELNTKANHNNFAVFMLIINVVCNIRKN